MPEAAEAAEDSQVRAGNAAAARAAFDFVRDEQEALQAAADRNIARFGLMPENPLAERAGLPAPASADSPEDLNGARPA